MDQFLDYFENEKFVQWVYTPDAELNKFWEERFLKYPREKKEADYARMVLLELKSRDEKGNTEEAVALYTSIADQLGTPDRKSAFRRFIIPAMRYAAVALVFLSLGIFLTNKINHDPFSGMDQSLTSIQDNSEAQLILSDGRKIALQSNDSRIDHEVTGRIVINGTDTINSQSEVDEDHMNQLIVPYGRSSSVHLPDGTVAHLNAGSKLIYPAVFKGKNREVYLVGEGLFEVTHNAERPFVVKTNALSIVALGTVFNVSAYPSDQVIETVLVEGKVVLRDNSFGLFNKDLTLKPSELGSFNRKTSETSSRRVDVQQYIAWQKGFLNFQSSDLSRIILQVERYYNIRIVLNDPMLGTRRITGKLVLKEDKDRVLEVLASTARTELFKINETTYGLK